MKPKGIQRIKRITISIALVAIISCDPFQEDFIPKENQVVFSRTDYYILPGSAVIIDLETIIQEAFTNAIITVSQIPSRGQLSKLDALLLKYQPNPNFLEGVDEFVFSVMRNDNLLKKEIITIHVKEDIEEFPCSLIAAGDAAYTKPDSTITIAVLFNDRLCGVDVDELQLSIHKLPEYGDVIIINDSIQYSPRPGFPLRDELVYKITSGSSPSGEPLIAYGVVGITNSLISEISMLPWGTYYGGSAYEHAYSTAVDIYGNVYLAGFTESTSGIATDGSHQSNFGGGNSDAFLVKFNSSGVRQWATYYGGNSTDHAKSIAIDNSGNVYVAGFSYSTSGIATSGCHQEVLAGDADAFLVKFNSAGVRQWGTYYGGSDFETANASVAVDPLGNIYLGGTTPSVTDIATPGSHQDTHLGGFSSAFLVKFSPQGARQWATYYGSSSSCSSIGIDASGNIFLAGNTDASSGIATAGSYQQTFNGVRDAFLVKFSSSGERQWATYYGGNNYDLCYSTAIDISGNVYLSGETNSTISIAAGGHQNTFSGGQNDAFLVKFNASGVRQWATYYGGNNRDWGYSTATDANGNVYLSGNTASASGIATPGSHKSTYSGGAGDDAYLVKFNSSGVRQWGTYYGGDMPEEESAMVIDFVGNIYLAGLTGSTNSIATSGGHQNSFGGLWDAFLVKFSDD